MKKKILGLVFFLSISCGPTHFSNTFTDDFSGVSEERKEIFLKENNALTNNRSILVFTQGYKGEKIIVKQNDKVIHDSYPITNLKNKIAEYFSFSTVSDLVVFDSGSKEEVLIPTKYSAKYKFIYVKRTIEKGKCFFRITYSNTLKQ